MAGGSLMLSVSGARGIVGESMTPEVALDFAAAWGSFIRQRSRGTAVICLGRDTRPSSQMLAAAAGAGLTAVGCPVIDLGVVATPTVSVMVGRLRAAGGMMITASHNPAPWNGLKCIGPDGCAPCAADVLEVVRLFREKTFPRAAAESIAPVARDGGGNAAHVERVLGEIDPAPIRAAGLKVVLDSINGAGCESGRSLLDSLGCDVLQINGEPHGRFAHDPEPVEGNLEQLRRATAAEEAAIGFALDPDGDRLAIVDERGHFPGEEYTVVLAARRVLDLRGGGPIVVNLSTSRMIDDLARRYPGASVHRTPVGEATVAAGMKATGALVGGEGNGGVIFRPVCWIRDGLSSMALILGLLAETREAASELVRTIPRYVMIKHRFDRGELSAPDAMRRAVDRVSKRFANERVSTADGVRIDADDGWVHLRPSNTEPIVRLIAEAATKERAWELLDEVAVAAGLR